MHLTTTGKVFLFSLRYTFFRPHQLCHNVTLPLRPLTQISLSRFPDVSTEPVVVDILSPCCRVSHQLSLEPSSLPSLSSLPSPSSLVSCLLFCGLSCCSLSHGFVDFSLKIVDLGRGIVALRFLDFSVSLQRDRVLGSVSNL